MNEKVTIPDTGRGFFDRHPNASESYGLALLWGLQGKPIWQGDATPHKTAKRRAKNRRARAARRLTRARS